MTKQKIFVRRIKADFKNLRHAIDGALAFFDEEFIAMDDATRLELKVVLNELLINAIKHGARNDAACYVKIVAAMKEKDCAMLIVEDDGEGYDTALVSKPIVVSPLPSRIEDLSETGRGIFIVKSLCEDFMVNEKGNKVVINKKLHRALTASA